MRDSVVFLLKLNLTFKQFFNTEVVLIYMGLYRKSFSNSFKFLFLHSFIFSSSLGVKFSSHLSILPEKNEIFLKESILSHSLKILNFFLKVLTKQDLNLIPLYREMKIVNDASFFFFFIRISYNETESLNQNTDFFCLYSGFSS